MATPSNTLQTVQLYIKTEIAYLSNEFWGIANSNKSLEEFNDRPGNLGDSITFDTSPRFTAYDGLVITQQPSVQRTQTLICSQAKNVSMGYTDEQYIFQAKDYMREFGAAATEQLGSMIEQDILKNIVSGVVGINPKSSQYGVPQIHSGPYRFYGDGVTPINSYGQLAQAWANFVSYGAAKHKRRAIIPVNLVPPIVNSGLNQFSPARNDEISRSWELGKFAGMDVDWGVSNLLPLHVAGTIANAAAPNNVMTVVSTNDATGANITQITFTEPTAGTDANAIKAGDLLQFNDGVSGKPNMRFLTFIGQHVTSLPVQFRATSDAATVAGSVTVSIETINAVGLVSAANQNQNINNVIQAGMTVTPVPSHQAGWMDAGDSFYLAMPKLPNQSPFESVYYRDPESGAGIRHYWGTQFGMDNKAYARDSVWGSTLIAEDSMRMCFPM